MLSFLKKNQMRSVYSSYMQNRKKHERYHIDNGIYPYEYNTMRLYNLRNPWQIA